MSRFEAADAYAWAQSCTAAHRYLNQPSEAKSWMLAFSGSNPDRPGTRHPMRIAEAFRPQ